jgi:YegS/Rv2252/BmrU family lipid kinase
MLLINPYSGKGITKTKLVDIISRFAVRNCCVTTFFTQNHDTSRLARELGPQYDTLVCAGGDGTLSDVVAGLVDAENPPPIGYIPMGTANDVASTLSLSRNLDIAVETALEGEPVSLDVGLFGSQYFTYIAAFGAFTRVSYATPQNTKRALGHLAYVLGGIYELGSVHSRRVRIEYDGGVIEDNFVFGGVTNSLSVAGLVKLNPLDVNLGDGKFEVILVKNPVNLAELSELLLKIAQHNLTSPSVTLLHTSRVKFSFTEPVKWTRDGEDGGAHSRIEITNRPRAVRILIPRALPEPVIYAENI